MMHENDFDWKHLTYFLLRRSTSKPRATRSENPILGIYNIRSATTNPTGKKIFDAGMNGITIKASA